MMPPPPAVPARDYRATVTMTFSCKAILHPEDYIRGQAGLDDLNRIRSGIDPEREFLDYMESVEHLSDALVPLEEARRTATGCPDPDRYDFEDGEDSSF